MIKPHKRTTKKKQYQTIIRNNIACCFFGVLFTHFLYKKHVYILCIMFMYIMYIFRVIAVVDSRKYLGHKNKKKDSQYISFYCFPDKSILQQLACRDKGH